MAERKANRLTSSKNLLEAAVKKSSLVLSSSICFFSSSLFSTFTVSNREPTEIVNQNENNYDFFVNDLKEKGEHATLFSSTPSGPILGLGLLQALAIPPESLLYGLLLEKIVANSLCHFIQWHLVFFFFCGVVVQEANPTSARRGNVSNYN